ARSDRPLPLAAGGPDRATRRQGTRHVLQGRVRRRRAVIGRRALTGARTHPERMRTPDKRTSGTRTPARRRPRPACGPGVRLVQAFRADDIPPDPAPRRARGGHAALGWAALLASLVLLWLVPPIGVGILRGPCLAFRAQPLFERLEPPLG